MGKHREVYGSTTRMDLSHSNLCQNLQMMLVGQVLTMQK